MNVLLIGGTSEIGLAIVRRLAREQAVSPYLLGRDRAGLDAALEQLRQTGCGGGTAATFEATALDSHPPVLDAAFDHAGGFDVVVLAVGMLGAQAGLEAQRDQSLAVMEINFLGAGSLLLESLRRMSFHGHGTLVVLSSVAGERVRASNPIYGAAKAGLDALAQGLGDAVAASGVRVLVVRPGFVHTRMTARLPPAPMATTPQAVADATVAALEGRARTIWVPRRLRYVFAVLRHLPGSIYRRLPL